MAKRKAAAQSPQMIVLVPGKQAAPPAHVMEMVISMTAKTKPSGKRKPKPGVAFRYDGWSGWSFWW